jgi:hypothetical protein
MKGMEGRRIEGKGGCEIEETIDLPEGIKKRK